MTYSSHHTRTNIITIRTDVDLPYMQEETQSKTKVKRKTKSTSHKCTSCGCIITNKFSVARGLCRVCNDSVQQLEAFMVTDMVGDLEIMFNPSGVTQRHDYEGDYAFSFR